MKAITQRELRNDNAKVIRAVEDGETFTVTRHGVPVARLGPYREEADLRCVRAATPGLHFTGMQRPVIGLSTAEILDDLRGDR